MLPVKKQTHTGLVDSALNSLLTSLRISITCNKKEKWYIQMKNFTQTYIANDIQEVLKWNDKGPHKHVISKQVYSVTRVHIDLLMNWINNSWFMFLKITFRNCKILSTKILDWKLLQQREREREISFMLLVWRTRSSLVIMA